MKMKFIVEVSTNKVDPNKLDIKIQKPTNVAKKWGSLALLTHMGLLKGLQEAYKVLGGETEHEDKTSRE